MKHIYAQYCGISLTLQSELSFDQEKICSVLEHYLPGIQLGQEKVHCAGTGQMILTITAALADEKEEGVWDVLSPDVVQAQVRAKKVYPYLILGVWTSAIDFLLQNRGLFFFHSASALIDEKAVLFWGPRADGKSTLAKTMADRGHRVLHDDRVGVASGFDVSEKGLVPGLAAEKIELLLTPKIIPAGELRMWPINPHSLRYELYCELSKDIRGVGTIEEHIVFQSLDNQELSRKRLQFCETFRDRLSQNAFFIEGTPEDICRFVETTLRHKGNTDESNQ